MQPKSCGCPHHTEALEREMCRAVHGCRPFADVSLLCSSSPTSALYAQWLHSQAIRSRVMRQNALTLVQASLEAHNELLERFLAREQQQLPAQLPTSPPAVQQSSMSAVGGGVQVGMACLRVGAPRPQLHVIVPWPVTRNATTIRYVTW